MVVVSNTGSLRNKCYVDHTRFNLVFVRIAVKGDNVFKGGIRVMTLPRNKQAQSHPQRTILDY
jgi:hypothetical protein